MEINESTVQAMSCQGPRGPRQTTYHGMEHSVVSRSAVPPAPSVPPSGQSMPHSGQSVSPSGQPCAAEPEAQVQTAGASHPSQPAAVAYHAAMPYPQIRAAGKNPRYAAAMLDNMGGQNSEMSAVALYFYDHLITGEFKEVSDTFHHISIVEMHHLEIFGTLAMQLGENPRLWSRRGRGGCIYWTPGYLHYPPFPVQGPVPSPIPSIVQPGSSDGSCSPPCPPNQKSSGASLHTLLRMAIEAEQAALNKYLQQATWIQDLNICDNLRRIAADEQMHIDILTRLYHRY